MQQLAWDGDAFEFQTALLGGRRAGFYTVTGADDADGSIKGTLRRHGNTQPPEYQFQLTNYRARSRGSGFTVSGCVRLLPFTVNLTA